MGIELNDIHKTVENARMKRRVYEKKVSSVQHISLYSSDVNKINTEEIFLLTKYIEWYCNIELEIAVSGYACYEIVMNIRLKNKKDAENVKTAVFEKLISDRKIHSIAKSVKIDVLKVHLEEDNRKLDLHSVINNSDEVKNHLIEFCIKEYGLDISDIERASHKIETKNDLSSNIYAGIISNTIFTALVNIFSRLG